MDRASRRPGPDLRRSSSLGVKVALAAVVAVLTWPSNVSVPSAGLDASWATALHMAAFRGLDHGSDIVFTYGPLGFLAATGLHYGWTAAAGIAFMTILRVALAYVLVTALLPIRWWVALVAALLICQGLPEARLLGSAELLAFIVFALCVRYLHSDPGSGSRLWFPIFGGALAGFTLLLKFNSGVVAFALVLVTAMAARKRLGDVAALLGSFAATLLLLALVVRQSITDLPSFLSNSWQIASGYSTAMGLEETGRQWEHGAAAVTIGGAAFVILAGTRTWSRHRRMAAALIGVIFVFSLFKLGFVRHDAHSVGFFASMALLPFAFTWTLRTVGPAAVHTLVSLGLMVASLQGPAPSLVDRFVDPRPSLDAIGQNFRYVFDAGERQEVLSTARSDMRASYALEEALLDRVGGAGVHIEPIEAGVAWAYPDVTWRPLPVFQTYSAYTASLDALDAGTLASEDGPEMILRAEPSSALRSAQITAPTIDARNPDYESPAATLAMLCHYDEAVTGERWQVLRRVPNRCDTPERIASVETTLGRTIEVPSPPGPEHLVYARIQGVGTSATARFKALLYKSDELFITLNGTSRYRVVPETVVNPLLMHVPAQADYSGIFALAPATESFVLAYAGEEGEEGDPITVEFYSLRIRP